MGTGGYERGLAGTYAPEMVYKKMRQFAILLK